MDAECPVCRYRAARYEIDCQAGDPLRLSISCGRCHEQVDLEGENAAAWLEGSGYEMPSVEWIVVTRNGQRHEVDATWYSLEQDAFERWTHRFASRPVVRQWPADQVTLVQRRNGHLLEQVWPAQAAE